MSLAYSPRSNPDPPEDEVVCPYCWGPTELVSDATIYGTMGEELGSTLRPPQAEKMYFLCAPCDAYVRQDPATGASKGTLANRALRSKRQRVFDLYFQIRKRQHCNHQRVQEMVAVLLHLPPKGGFIRNMDVATCDKAIRVCELALGKEGPG